MSPPPSNSINQSQERNIVIIGAGIIGSSTAYFLTRHPNFSPSHHKIHLLDSVGVASAASGKAGGLLALWAYPASIVPLSFELHRQLADEHGGEGRWGYRPVGVGSVELKGRKIPRGSIRMEGTAVGEGEGKGTGEGVEGVHVANGRGGGNVDVSLEKRSEESYSRLRKKNGVPDNLDWVADECVLGYESMGGPHDTAQVHPYQFTTSMAKLAEEKGLKVVLGKCEGIDVDEATNTVRGVQYRDRASGEMKAIDGVTDVVVAAGPWSGTVLPGVPVGALRAHSVTIRPSRPVSAYALFTQISLPKNYKEGITSKASHVSPEIYARPNNELYACGEGDHLVPLPETSDKVEVDEDRCQDIIDYCATFSDEMRDGEVMVKQACYLPQATRGNGPFIGLTKTKGLFLATAHTCWGIQNGPGTGKLMSEFVFDGKATSADVGALDPRRVMR